MGAMDHDGRGGLVDLTALDPDQAVLDVVDAADAVGAGKFVQLLDEGYRVKPVAVQGDRDAAFEADDDLDRCRGLVRIDGPLVDVLARRHPWILEDAGLDRATP